MREAVLDQTQHYAQLEQGARYLASRALDEVERREHLGWANRYCRLRLDASEAPAGARLALKPLTRTGCSVK